MNIEPKTVFKHFLEISKIPRGSGNEKAVSNYIKEFAQKHGAEVMQDEWNNLIIKKEASEKLKSRPPIILQAHLDMVCEKNADTQHDFMRDPLNLYTDGDFLRAKGTTLGADDGIGVAMCMALIEGKYEHPPLEIILTTDEESGMTGAENLDISTLKGTRMLNLDSSDDTTFTMGCAAGTTAEIFIPTQQINIEVENFTESNIFIKGLKGGHSGSDIHLERGNALRILAFLLDEMLKIENFHVKAINGGMKINAIPREAQASVIFPHSMKKKFALFFDAAVKKFTEQFKTTEPNLCIDHEIFDNEIQKHNAFSNQVMRKIIAALLLIPTGVISNSVEIEGLVNASCNIGVAETLSSGVKIQAMPRGAASYYVQQTESQISALAEQLNIQANFLQRSPAWSYNSNSELLTAAKKVYKHFFNTEANVTAVHGGLECGIFSAKFAARNINLDIVSFGANAYDYHTPFEKLSISSVKRVWEFLLEFLKEI